ncbi:hypothetical protein AALP_AA1G083900 [Arabis alpina]|uniref:Btz domain-containing protein n=1 Tax=Arabis alpina TaxID=50452 RepID=A0A087HLX6_ARAAL|nr:hypothetical protein AALP_AA1G083900 [Arabis alpina]
MSLEASELQDLSSDETDFTASHQKGSDSEKRSLYEGGELVYSKDDNPTQVESERISGRLKLTKQDSLVFLLPKTKGSRSSTRRKKKSLVAAEPEKLGVSGLGQHCSERVEHVPIKKRRFMVRSPSPESSEHRAQINNALLVSSLVDGRTLDEKPDCSGHDFSGIEILAAVACSSDVSNDIAPAVVESLPAEESVVPSTHVEGNDSSAGTVGVDSSDQVGQGKNAIVAPQKYSVENLALESGEAVKVSDKSLADDLSEKNNESCKDVRLHWDLNVTMDAWGQPCDTEDVASGRDVEREITESIAPKESEPVVESKEHMVGVIASDGHANSQSPSGPKSEVAARNGLESQSGYDSQYEDGELREPYPWEETEGDMGEIEQVDYGSEPEDERFYSVVESSDNKMEAETNYGLVKCESGDAPRRGEANEGSDTEKHVVVCLNYSHRKKGSSSPSRSFVSRPFKELPSHDAIQRRRPNNYEELSTGSDKFNGRDDRSGMSMRNRSPGRGYFGGWDSKRRFSPPNYKGSSYGFGRSRPKSMVDDRSVFDQSGPGPGPGPDGHVRRQFSDGGYRGRFRRFPDGGDRDFRGWRGDSNQFRGRMHNWMRRERGNSPVFRRLHYPQSESRSRSRSPVSWNGRNRSPPPLSGFRADERMMERVRVPFQKQKMGFTSPPRNRMSSPRFFEGRNNNDAGENHNSFRERKFWPGQRFDTGNSMRRVNSDNNNNNHFRPFIRHRRFEGMEENKFEMAQQRSRRSEAIEDDGDDNRPLRLNGEQSVVVTNNNNKEP